MCDAMNSFFVSFVLSYFGNSWISPYLCWYLENHTNLGKQIMQVDMNLYITKPTRHKTEQNGIHIFGFTADAADIDQFHESS